MPTLGRKRRAPARDEDEASNSATPAPAARSQRRRSGSSVSEALDDEATGEDTSQQQMVKNLVRLALACEHARRPIRRQDINEKALNKTSRAFKNVFDAAQLALRSTFGMEMVELPAKEKVTLKDKRAAQKAQSQGGSSSSSKSWTLSSVLPQEYCSEGIIGPARVPTSEEESAYTGLYSFIVSVIALSGGRMPQARLERVLSRMNADNNTPTGTTDELLKRMEKQSYIFKVVEQQGGEDMIDYMVGPRGRTELGNDGVAGLVRRVYGQTAPEDLEQRLTRSLKVAELEREPIENGATQANGVNGQANGGPRRGRRRQQQDEDD